MSRATFCDRCRMEGKDDLPVGWTRLNAQTRGSIEFNPMILRDLCPDCAKEFEEWFKMPENMKAVGDILFREHLKHLKEVLTDET